MPVRIVENFHQLNDLSLRPTDHAQIIDYHYAISINQLKENDELGRRLR